jgi:hypothetical protein
MCKAILSISYKASQNGIIYDVMHVVGTLSRNDRQDRHRKLASVMSAGSGSSVKGVDVLELGLGVTGVAMPDADSDIKRTLCRWS